ncbi:MAG: NAD-dependent DNA ligase LigA [Lachnospiraceae bacterium]|nr:NAD-dependent DNA ligase LigA [Lachnospiraceae bacterium]
MDEMKRIKELVEILNKAAEVYYSGQDEIMSNFEYDKLYDELLMLEEKTGVILSNSPTSKVGFEVSDNLPKVEHESPMLSLDKTKDRETLRAWLKDKEGLLSWKMDGLTVVLTYENGELSEAVTRGNGTIGELVTANAKTFTNIPLKISFKGKLCIRGEAVIPYSIFEKINSELPEEEKYKNPRNLCSGSVRQLDSSVAAKRKISFFAFALVTATYLDGDTKKEVDFNNSNEEKFKFLVNQGFQVVEYKKTDESKILDDIEWFSNKITTNDFPSDGLVLLYNDIQYGLSLGRTAKFPRNAIAFKWMDETALTHLINIEWNASRTGLINPIAVFEPVELEGTTVQRASVHNVSIVRELKLGVGDEIKVYKANMIIPQISENLTMSDNCEIPKVCPVCGSETSLKTDDQKTVLMCNNPDCTAKKLNSFVHFVSRDAMNIDGLSKMTIEKFIALGFVKEPADFYDLEKYESEIISIEGFGNRAFNNLQEAIEKSKNVKIANFIFALGILNVGLSNAKLIAKYFNYDFDKIRNLKEEDLVEIDGIGDVIAKSFTEYFANESNKKKVDDLLKYITFEKEVVSEENETLSNLIFVITGSLNVYGNRSELKEYIEGKGGKVAGSVSKKTSFLINNDNTSTSSKNKKAQELNVPIITEAEFIERFGE